MDAAMARYFGFMELVSGRLGAIRELWQQEQTTRLCWSQRLLQSHETPLPETIVNLRRAQSDKEWIVPGAGLMLHKHDKFCD